MKRGKKIRVLVAKPGLDGHDVGAKVVVRALMEAGFDVIYTGLRKTPEQIAQTASDEDVDVLGLSILSGSHIPICRRLRDRLRECGLADIPWLVGGNIPQRDHQALEALGVDAVFGVGTPTQAIVDFMNPDRIVIGQWDEKSGQTVKRLYDCFDCPMLITNLPTAEMTKYVSNALLATLISYSNEIAGLCESVAGVDVMDVFEGVHLDNRFMPFDSAAPGDHSRRIKPGVLTFQCTSVGRPRLRLEIAMRCERMDPVHWAGDRPGGGLSRWSRQGDGPIRTDRKVLSEKGDCPNRDRPAGSHYRGACGPGVFAEHGGGGVRNGGAELRGAAVS